MARMSIDDKFLRDPRVTRLAEALGWSRYEARGRLLDVFAVCYDLETDIITPEDANAAADEARLADAMLSVGLADLDEDGIRVHGAAERIEYLAKKAEAGRKGGVKSGETRRKKCEAKRSSASPKLEEVGNPPDPVPDVVPDPVPDQIPDPPPARAIPPVVAEPDAQQAAQPEPLPPPTRLPVAWSGPPDHQAVAARAVVRKEILAALEAARERVSKALGKAYRPLPAQDQAERVLAARIVEAGNLAAIRDELLHVVEMAALEAEHKTKSLQWLTGAAFSDGNYRRFAAGDEADFARSDPRGPDIAAIRATPDEMDTARAVLEQLSEGSSKGPAPIVWRVDDGHAAIVVQRLREIEAVRPGYGHAELCAVAAVACDELEGKDRTRKLLTPGFVFGPAKFAELLTMARATYEANIEERTAERAAERRKAAP